MAAGDKVTSSSFIMRQGDVARFRANSEAIMTKIASGMNFLKDSLFYDENFEYSGYFSKFRGLEDGMGGIRLIRKDSQVELYYLTMRNIGTSGTNQVNFQIYDNVGAFVGNLFGTGLTITGNGGNTSRVIVGKENISSGSPTDIDINTSGVSHNNGTLNFTTLLAGWQLVPQVIGSAKNAKHALLKLRLIGV